MGQYFKLVNTAKREVVSPWEIGGSAKFFEWIANDQARVLVWLLRQSTESGGGDVDPDHGYTTLGRWAGDPVTLVGDYDASGLYQEADECTNISAALRREFNDYCAQNGIRDYQL